MASAHCAAKLQTKEEVGFGKALLATGARVNILHHLEGARLDGIHYLRTLGNSDAIREEAGRFFHDALESHGIEILGGEELDSFVGENRVSAVRTKSGREIECDAV